MDPDSGGAREDLPGSESLAELKRRLEEEVEGDIASATTSVQKGKAIVESPSTKRTGEDRSLIVRSVILTFVAITVALSFFAMTGSWTEREQSSEFILKVLSSVLLPVVTLVIGYYFGSKEKEKEQP